MSHHVVSLFVSHFDFDGKAIGFDVIVYFNFSCFAQNIDCGYSSRQNRIALIIQCCGSNVTCPQFMCCAKMINYYYPFCYMYISVEFRATKLHRL